MNIVFAGTPEFAAVHLRALLHSSHHIAAVYTQPDRPAGRGKKLTPSAVKVVAEQAGLPVLQPASLKSEETQRELAAFKPDIMVVVAYGLLLPKPVLDIPGFGCINVHASLLPRWRGAAPIQRAIEAGDDQTGVTIMQMDVGLDTGDMWLKSKCDILPTDTASILHDRLCEIGPSALLETLSIIEAGQQAPQEQDHSGSTYARKLEKSEAAINWQLDAETLCRRIRAFNPFPVCYAMLGDERLRVYYAEVEREKSGKPGRVTVSSKNKLVIACGSGAISVKELQLPGKKPMSVSEFMNGFGDQLKEGTQLT